MCSVPRHRAIIRSHRNHSRRLISKPRAGHSRRLFTETRMKITLKLFATLSDHLPAGARGNQVELELDPTEPVGALIERLRLPARLVHLVLINGNYVAPADRATRCLQEGDQLAIWPPVAGG